MPQNDDSHHFVSRGGVKLQASLDKFHLDVKDLVVLDVGSSTGGFVDCLLQNGAKKVYAIDTCYGELAWKLRNDPRVVVMERTNTLHLNKLPGSVIVSETKQSEIDRHADARDDNTGIDLITIDAGWTKLELVLPVVKKFLKTDGVIIALLKPHYEAQGLLLRNEAEKQFKGGVVPEEKVESIKNQVIANIKELGFGVEEEMESPILGGAGNREYLLLIK